MWRRSFTSIIAETAAPATAIPRAGRSTNGPTTCGPCSTGWASRSPWCWACPSAASWRRPWRCGIPITSGRLVLSSTAAKFRLDRCLDTFLRLHGTRARAVAEAFWTDPGRRREASDYMDECFPLYNPTPRPPDADKRSTFNPAMLHHFFRADGEGFRFDFRRQLKDVRCPTLVLAGDLDPVTPLADSEDIAAALPARLVRFETLHRRRPRGRARPAGPLLRACCASFLAAGAAVATKVARSVAREPAGRSDDVDASEEILMLEWLPEAARYAEHVARLPDAIDRAARLRAGHRRMRAQLVAERAFGVADLASRPRR